MSMSLTKKARFFAALLVVFTTFFATLSATAQVTLYPSASPSSAQAGVQVVTITGFGFPDGNIHPTDVKVQFSPVSVGSAVQTIALEATRITGSTVRIRFTVPSTLVVSTATDYNVGISGQTYDGVKFTSTSSSTLTVIPPSSVTLSPNEADSGSTVWVDVTGTATDFAQGATYARFGAGSSVGGGAIGDFGLLTVNSATSARALVTIDPSTAPGPHTVTVITGAQQASAAFSVTTPHQPPVADAGPQQLVKPGALVQLDGSRSTSPSGAALTYQWSFVSVPTGSRASLSNNSIVNPTFQTDLAGDYVVQLTVNDGTASTTASVTITMQDTAPVANAGHDQSANPGDWITLDASGSSDADGDQLTFLWSFKSKPQGSAAVLSDAKAVTPRFMVDALGTYVLQLTVDDGHGNNSVATVNVSTSNQAPKADAGAPFTVPVGAVVHLDGSHSTDPDSDPLIYSWTLISRPTGSNSTLLDNTSVSPTFSPDVAGNYVAQLTVNDQHGHTSVATVGISTQNSPPVADAGPAQSVNVGDTVNLTGAASSDPDGDLLTYSWSLIVKPAGSNASLSSTNSVNSSFVADVAGDFVAQLIVGDPTSSSAPSTVLVAVTAARPAVDPQLVNFGSQPVSVTSNSRTIVVTNTTAVPMSLTGVSITGPDAAQFRATAPAMPMTVPAGESTSLNVTFTPSAPGARSAMLVVNQGGTSAQTTQLAGTGVSSPSISYTPGAISFSNQPVGVVSNAIPVTVSNTGTSILTLSSFSLSGPNPQDFGFSSANLPIDINPGASAVINFTFKPTAAGSRSALMLITDNAAGSPHSIALSGNGLAPVFGATPASVLFADQALSTTSSPSTVSVKNSGTAPLVVSAVSITGTNSTEFAANPGTLPLTVNPGGTTLIPVTFTPIAVGARSATLVVTDNAGGSPHSIPLSGNGVTVAAVQLLNSTVDFGNVQVGKSGNSTLQVKNTGSANLVISGVSIGGGNSTDFKATATTFPVTVAPGATGVITLTFTPPVTGTRTGTVTLIDNVTGVVTATLTGVGTKPTVTLGATSLDFGKQLINSTSAVKTVSIKNSGTADLVVNTLTITGAAAGDFTTSTAAPFTVTPGNSTNISLTFKTAVTGARSATLSIADNASGSPHTVSLSGTGTAPGIGVTPASIPFANQRVGTTSSASVVTISNPGTADLHVTALSITGANASDYSFGTVTLPLTVAPNASTTLNVTYKPGALGASSATLNITNDAGAAKTVALTGNGVNGDTTVNFSPTALDLGTSPVGTAAASKSIVVNNTGSAPLKITAIQITGANSTEFTFTSAALPITVNPGGFSTVSVGFKPQAVGPRTANLIFTDNADGSPHSIALTGKGQGVPVIDVSSAALNFGNQNVGKASSPKNLVIGNKGTDDLIISSLTLTGTNASDFTTTQTVPLTVAPNTTVSIPVVFKPTTTGNRSASLRIVSNSAGSPSLAPLSGVGTQPVISVAPSSINFGSRAVNTTSSGSAVTITNTGTGPLTVSGLAFNGANMADFAFSGPSLPAVIQPNGSISVSVTFTPGAVGPRAANLVITHDAGAGTTQISLTGTGAPNGPAVDVSPLKLDFGNQPLANAAAVKSVTVTNSGNQDLTITAVSISGANVGDFSASNSPLPIKVVAGGNTVIQISFKPTAQGSRVANLSITHNAPGSPSLVALAGNGTAPAINVSPTSIDFGLTTTNVATPAKNVVITNPGTAPLTISSLVLTGATPASFSASAGAIPATINPGGSLTIAVVMKPVVGDNSATLTINHNATGGSSAVSLTGKGGNVGATTASVSPAILAFGSVDLSSSSSKPVVISNTGGVNLILSSLAITGLNASDFTLTAAATPINVSPSGSVVVSVKFVPGDVGSRTATLTIVDNATGSPHTVQLTGTGFINGAAIRLSTNSLSFPDQLKNTASVPLPITISNPGNTDLSISALKFSGPQGADFGLSPVTLPLVVPKNGGSKTINVIFTPADFGARAGTLTITSNASTPNVNVSLSGNGTGPIIAFVPAQASLDFGSQPTLTKSAPQQLVIKNVGTGNLTITSLNIPIPQFQVDPVQLPLIIAAGGTATLNISFAPTLPQAYSTTLNIADNAQGAPHTVALTGTGVAAQMTFMPADKLDFGSQVVGNSSSPKPVALINSGSVTLVITSVTVAGANPGDYTVAPLSLPATVDPGKNLSLTITFKPGAKGQRPATLVVANNTASTPQSLSLTGSGAGPVISVAPNPITFNSQINGTSSTPVDLVVTNTGDAPLTISGVTITGANASDFSAGFGPFPMSVQPGAANALHVPVTFKPSASGSRSATINISSNANATATTVSLSGVGVPPPVLVANPTQLTFAAQFLNSTSAPKSVSISNTGGSPLVINSFAITGANPGDFAVVSGPLPLTINPGSNTTVNFTFTPAGPPVAPAARTATVTINSNVPGNPAAIGLSGTAQGEAKFVLGTSPINFGSQFVTTASAPFALQISNPGTADLHITNIAIGGSNPGDFTVPNPGLPITIPAGASTTLNVVFTPATTGPRAANITFADDGTGNPHVLQVTGTGVQPVIKLTPANAVPFGLQLVNTPSAPQTLNIANIGTADLIINSLTVSGPQAAEFTFTQTLPVTINAGKSLDLSIVFKPTAAGARTATLTIGHNAGSSIGVALSGTGTKPNITLTPNTLTNDFGTVIVGNSSSPFTITIGNTGNGPLNISSITLAGQNPGDFTISTPTLPVTVNPNSSIPITATFKPTADGARAAVVSIASNNDGSPHAFNLTGTGKTISKLSLSSTTVTFPNQLVGTTSSPTAVTVTNTGSANLVISALNVTGTQAAEFTVQPSSPLPLTIAPNANAQLSITFAPTSLKPSTNRTATLGIVSNASTSPDNVALSGTSFGVPAISFPASVNAGSQRLNSASAPVPVSIGNTGTADLHVTSLTISGANAGEFTIPAGVAPTTIAPGANIVVNVTFTPTSLGARTANLNINDDATGSPHVVVLNGTGAFPAITTTPASPVTFPDQLVTVASTPLTLSINNTGNADLIVSALSMAGTNPGDFTLAPVSLPVTIAAGQSFNLSVTFKPPVTGLGARSAFLNISHNAPGAVLSVQLQGNGVQPTIVTVPTGANSLNFSSTAVGATSASQNVTITNTGTGTATISALSFIGTNPGDFVIAQTTLSNLPISIPPNQSIQVPISFAPTAVGTRTASLRINDNAPGTPHVVGVMGTAVQGNLTIITNPASNPPLMTFGALAVNSTSPAKTVTLQNSGQVDINITSITITGAQAGDYALVSPPALPLKLVANASVTLSVTFTPTNTGARNASIQLVHDAQGATSITLNGSGTQPIISVAASLDLGKQAVNSTGQKTLSVSNTGNGDLIITNLGVTGTNAGDFSVSLASGTLPLTINPNKNATLNINFTPGAEGARSASLSITHNAPGSPTAVALTGTGVTPVFSPNPASALTFSTPQNLGDSSAPQTITVTNTGNGDLVINAISATGTNAADFLVSNPTLPITVPPQGSMQVSVVFKPTTGLGARTAAVTFQDNANGNPHVITLSGTAVGPTFSASPTSLVFGNVNIGALPAQLPLSINNTGNGDLVISNIVINGDPSIVGDYTLTTATLPIRVTPGQKTTITVNFAPKGPGTRPVTITFTDNALDTPQSVNVTGNGVGPVFTGPATQPVEFPRTNVNTNSQIVVVPIKNTGNASMLISKIQLTGDAAADFLLAGASTPVAVSAGSTLNIQVVFRPKTASPQDKNANITFTDNALGTPHNVQLHGIASVPTQFVAPPQITVGYNMETVGSISLNGPAAADIPVTITSSDQNLVLLSSDPNGLTAGTKSITMTIPAGAQSLIPGFYVQGLASSGTATLTFTATGLNTVSVGVQLVQSGFIISTPSGAGANFSNVIGGAESQLIIFATTHVSLNPDGSVASFDSAKLRGGLANLTIPLQTDNSNVGIIDGAAVFNPGITSSSGALFKPVGGGTTTITLTPPAGFTNFGGTSVTATVSAPAIRISPVTVGANLQVRGQGTLDAPAPANGVSVTITSTNSLVTLSTSPSTAGSNSINLVVPGGATALPTFYVFGMQTVGSSHLNVSATGYVDGATLSIIPNPHYGDVAVTPSGFMINAPGQNYGDPFSTTTISGNTRFTVTVERLDPSGNPAGDGTLRGGIANFTVPVISGTTSVGSISFSPTTFTAGGTSTNTIQFVPLKNGTTTVSVGTPSLAGFSTPTSGGSMVVTVTQPQIQFSMSTNLIGVNLQEAASGRLTANAPTNLQLTITSNNSLIVLSKDPTLAGSTSITLTIPQGTGLDGSGFPNYYIQALPGSLGQSATLTATANGFATATTSVTATPSGFVLISPNGLGGDFGTIRSTSDVSLTVAAKQLAPGSLVPQAQQGVRGGIVLLPNTFPVTVVSDTSTVGTVIDSPAQFNPGDDSVIVHFRAANKGTTLLHITQPSGSTTPSVGGSLSATVN